MHWHGKEMWVEIALINIINVGVSANNAAHLHRCSFICTPMQLSKRDGRCECVTCNKKSNKKPTHTHKMSGVMLCTIMFIYVCILVDSSIKYNGHTS